MKFGDIYYKKTKVTCPKCKKGKLNVRLDKDTNSPLNIGFCDNIQCWWSFNIYGGDEENVILENFANREEYKINKKELYNN